MRQLVVLSGKGGTGKTSVVASLASLVENAVLVDCDVEAPDLHLVLSPERQRTEEFVGGKIAWLQWEACIGCGRCEQLCRYDAIERYGMPNRFTDQTYIVKTAACEGCNLCAEICPADAIQMMPSTDGEWFMSDTQFGPLVHARLRPGRGNSGKLVSLLRQEAKNLAEAQRCKLVLADGVPGIGCPVIASVSGVDLALIVAEPSVSGLHDLERVLDLTKHFSVPALVCINKYDVAESLTAQIETRAAERDVEVVGRIPHDPAVVAAQMSGVSVVEHGDSPAAQAIRAVWARVAENLEQIPATA